MQYQQAEASSKRDAEQKAAAAVVQKIKAVYGGPTKPGPPQDFLPYLATILPSNGFFQLYVYVRVLIKMTFKDWVSF